MKAYLEINEAEQLAKVTPRLRGRLPIRLLTRLA
jgi:hypothetical protein